MKRAGTTRHSVGNAPPSPILRAIGFVFAIGLVAGVLSSQVLSQTTTASAAPASVDNAKSADKNAPEVSSHEEIPTFSVKVNLVQVRVVVRDAQGRAISGLKQDDFELFDNGKLQVIRRFSADQPASNAVNVQGQSAASGEPSATPAPATAPVMPQNYIAYMFDDVHLNASEISLARKAAEHQLQFLQPEDRAGIYTTSGQNQLDFTDDREQLTAALNRLIPIPVAKTSLTSCPDISYYMADLIQNKHDQRAQLVATLDALACAFMNDQTDILVGKQKLTSMALAENLAKSTARQELLRGDEETRLALDTLRNLVHRIATMPGQRTIILVSPGFTNPDALQEETDLMELALHSNVVINALDARGLYTDLPDASAQRAAGHEITGTVQQYRTAELAANSDIMADLAGTTGGIFFHNNNDLDEGFRRLSAAPDYSYLLGFSPQEMKLDGHYHKLKVTLKSPAKGVIQARKGYYAPSGTTDPAQKTREAVEDAVFSREELREIPVELQTQFFRTSDTEAKLSVVARVDVKHMHFRKVNGRNDNDVTIVSAVFDRNGNLISGNQKIVQLHLKDETLESRLGSGINLKTSFDVKPGSYVVRLVVRNEEGQLSAQNSAVEIE